MKIFITGGAGYIGSHSLLQLLKAGHQALVYDNYCNSNPESLARVKRLANRDFQSLEGDVRDGKSLNAAMEAFQPDVVIHFAGLKAVGESVDQPLNYYENNVFGSIEVLRAMDRCGCRAIVFSSTATVYGQPEYLPFDEGHPLRPESPYGHSKLMVEQVIDDWVNTDPNKSAVSLRYFNPVGAHESGEIGEDPFDIPNNLMPYVQQVAIGRRQELTVHGNDYDTPDGTGVRDFIHVEDLAAAHLKAAEFVAKSKGSERINIGTGRGYSVLEIVRSFEKASGRKVPYQIGPRRAGDIATSLAKADKARKLLGWQAELDIDDMTRSAWHFQKRNPKGYAG